MAQVAPQVEAELDRPQIVESLKKYLQSILRSTKRLFDTKHTFCYFTIAFLATAAVIIFFSLYMNSPLHALSQFVYDSEHQKNPDDLIVQLEVTQLTRYHNDIIITWVCFICLLVLSASLFIMGRIHCNKPAGNPTVVLTIVFLLLLTVFTLLTPFKCIHLLLNNGISTEITTMLQAGPDSALQSLQDRNRCCKIIMSTKSHSNTICRHETNVPNCTEMFTNIISYQHTILWLALIFIILPMLCLFCYNFVYPIFKKYLSPTTTGNEQKTEEEEEEEEEEELNAAADQIPLLHQQIGVDSRTVQSQFPSYDPEASADLTHQSDTSTEPINSTEIKVENSRGTNLSFNVTDRSQLTFHSDNSELSHRRNRNQEFNSEPLPIQDNKKNEKEKFHSQ